MLREAGAEAFLVSAYDIANSNQRVHQQIAELLAASIESGQHVLVDSGNYESFWKSDGRWSRSRFHEAVRRTVPQDCLVLAYDNQSPDLRAAKIVDEVVRGFERDQKALLKWRVQPIVHAVPQVLPKVCAAVAARLKPDILAVPERVLGNGIVERARTLRAIRQEMNDRLDRWQILHLLGTGNPWSLLAFVACGADSFDGLEWCQTVVDHERATLHHLQHYDFFAWQSNFSQLSKLSFIVRALGHNLSFYADWIERLRQASATRSLGTMAREVLPSAIARDLSAALPNAFPP